MSLSRAFSMPSSRRILALALQPTGPAHVFLQLESKPGQSILIHDLILHGQKRIFTTLATALS